MTTYFSSPLGAVRLSDIGRGNLGDYFKENHRLGREVGEIGGPEKVF